MGSSVSALSSTSISEDLMEDYITLTYLSRNEIFKIYKRLSSINPEIHKNVSYRFQWEEILTVFPELKVNPFADRLACVFSSQLDARLSLEDMLDMYSALSPECPTNCKAMWALKLFDFNDSNSLEVSDIVNIIDRLTSVESLSEEPKCLELAHKEKIATMILNEIDLDHTGSIITVEFVHAVSKIPDFYSSFTLKL